MVNRRASRHIRAANAQVGADQGVQHRRGAEGGRPRPALADSSPAATTRTSSPAGRGDAVVDLPWRTWPTTPPGRNGFRRAATCRPLPDGVTYTFRTTFELTGRRRGRPSAGRFIADNHVTAIRLNGTAVSVPNTATKNLSANFTRSRSRKGFVDGTNVLEMEVFNGLPGAPLRAVTSPMALLVELKGSVLQGWRVPPQRPTTRRKRAAERRPTNEPLNECACSAGMFNVHVVALFKG